MAITVKFYSFAKKINSTAVLPPATVPVYSTDRCLIKSGSQIVSPDLEIALPAATNISTWNYAHIPNFGRYYFIMDATYDNGQWVFHLQCDVLATYKSAIGGSTQYIARSVTKYDTNVIDTAYPVKTDPSTVESVSGSALSMSYTDSGNYYVVGILNNDSANQTGCVSYYAMTPAQLGSLKNLLLTDNTWIGNVDAAATPVEISQSKTQINPMQYIVSCKRFPWAVATGGAVSGIHCGWWNAGISASSLSGSSLNYETSFTVIHHPQASRGNYLNSKAYCTYTLDFAGVHFDLDGDLMGKCSTITITVCPDYITGDASFRVVGSIPNYGDVVLGCVTQPWAADIPLGQITTTSEGLSGLPSVMQIPFGSIAEVGMNFTRSIGSFIKNNFGTKNAAGQTATAARGGFNDYTGANLTGIGTALGLNSIAGTYSGTPGSMAAVKACPQPRLKSVFKLIADENLVDYGRPLCQRTQISTMSGFIKCSHAELSLTATTDEVASIIDFMEGGFFYE